MAMARLALKRGTCQRKEPTAGTFTRVHVYMNKLCT